MANKKDTKKKNSSSTKKSSKNKTTNKNTGKKSSNKGNVKKDTKNTNKNTNTKNTNTPKKSNKLDNSAKGVVNTLHKQTSTTPKAMSVAAMKNIDAPTMDTSNPFGFITDKNAIQTALDRAANAAYDVKAQEANQGLNRAEDTAYANTQEAVRGLKNSMNASAAGGANRGAAGANALQALLGLGQQNNQLTTEGLRAIQNVAGERAAAIAQNAADAIDKANTARQMQGALASEKYQADTQRYSADSEREAQRYVADSERSANIYGADQSYRQAAATALGALSGSLNTDATNERMNSATNKANIKIAGMPQKTINTNINQSTEKVVTKNTNINRNK